MVNFLTKTQLEQFEVNGYLIIPNFFTLEEAQLLKKRIPELIQQLDTSNCPLTTFSTDENKQIRDEYFLESADKISFFFEEGAVDQKGKLLTEKELAINKIGHALHYYDQEFRRFTTKPEIKAIARDLGFADPIVLQSMVICKQPRIGGKVIAHQDSTFLYTEPLSAVGFWFALEDCTKENGCLSFIPGSHKEYPIKRRFIRTEDGKSTTWSNDKAPVYDETGFEFGEVKAGSLVLIHGSVVHQSELNTSDKSRNIYTFHLIEGKDTVYDEKNWLQYQNRPMDKLFSMSQE